MSVRAVWSVVVGADTLNVEAARTSPPRALEVADVGRLNGGLRDPAGCGLNAAATDVGDRETERRGTAHRDNVDSDLGASSAIDLTMYGTTPAARGMVSPLLVFYFF